MLFGVLWLLLLQQSVYTRHELQYFQMLNKCPSSDNPVLNKFDIQDISPIVTPLSNVVSHLESVK